MRESYFILSHCIANRYQKYELSAAPKHANMFFYKSDPDICVGGKDAEEEDGSEEEG
jgi:hypothetical protein